MTASSAPLQYMSQRRMLLATHLPARSNAPLARTAEEVGYQTDTAFSRAFRREYGMPRDAWRRRQTGQQQVPVT
jgi:AraC-like DNA-binding protein